MPISGPVIHRQLMDGYQEAERRLAALRQRSGQADQQRQNLDDHRDEALVNLAEHYLPELTREAIRNTWIEVRSKVSQILLRKEDHCNRMKTTLAEWNDKRFLQNERLTQVTADMDVAINEQEELSQEVEEQLKQDPEFVRLSESAVKAESALERAEANLNEIEQDSARKIPAYEKSTMFTYLRDRKFGTAEYKKRGLTRRMDRWLAKFIDYKKAKQGYEFLKRTPDRMRQIIAEDRASFDTVMDELERRNMEVARRVGLTAKVDEVAELQARRKEVLVELDDVQSHLDDLQTELTDLEDPRGAYYREAIEVFRETLSQCSTRDLERRARATVEITDDQIVARLNGVELELAQIDDFERNRQHELVQMQGYLAALGGMIQRFRASEFDSARSQFVGTFDVLEAIHRGKSEYDVEELWQRIRGAQRWGPTLGEQITNIATHPVTQVGLNVAAQIVGAALGNRMRRAGRRRYRGSTWFDDSSDDYYKRRR